MTVSELQNQLGLKVLAMPSPEKIVENGYAGDLLSWVMGNAPHGCAWLTIMTNRNIIAVAELLDMACVIVAEDCLVEESVCALAMEQKVNLLSAEGGVFPLCGRVAALL
jgi:hypothetical protein